MFCGFMSQCRKPRECACTSARSICAKKRLAAAASRRPPGCAWMKSSSSGPCTRCITMYVASTRSSTSITRTMCSCAPSSCSTCTSHMMLCSVSPSVGGVSSPARSFLIFLTAMFSLLLSILTVAVPATTVPSAPWPMVSPSSMSEGHEPGELIGSCVGDEGQTGRCTSESIRCAFSIQLALTEEVSIRTLPSDAITKSPNHERPSVLMYRTRPCMARSCNTSAMVASGEERSLQLSTSKKEGCTTCAPASSASYTASFLPTRAATPPPPLSTLTSTWQWPFLQNCAQWSVEAHRTISSESSMSVTTSVPLSSCCRASLERTRASKM
mmetsp:Transcript_47136/g.109374  ORF Transcript_47136/g.109374 Transcript_47136/m.109374 type:complete len:327 (+) Transcript_47136:768-1748(+)